MMSYNDKDLINVICDISEVRAMKVAVNSAVKSGLIVGTAATIGGLLFGPRGVALGSLLAGVSTSYAMEGQFRSVPDIIINDLSTKQQHDLAQAIRNLLTAENIMTVMQLMTAEGVKDILVQLISHFLRRLQYDL